MIEKLLNNSRKKNIIILIFMLFVVFGSLLNSYINYMENKNTLYNSLDKILKNTALQYNDLLPENFHTIALNKDSIPAEEDRINITRSSRYINSLDVIYGYTTIVQDDKLYFTSSSSTEEEIREGKETFYFDHYKSANVALFDIIKQDKITYLNIEDKWGSFRSVNIPMVTKESNRYILSADIEISFINEQLDEYLYKIFLTQTIIFLVLIILGIYFFKISKIEIKEIVTIKQNLEESIEEKTKELNTSLKIYGENVITLQFDAQGAITYVSPAFYKLSGYSTKDFLEKKSTNFSNINMNQIMYQKVCIKEIQEYKKNGEMYWLSISIVPEYDTYKNIIGYTSICHDITAQKARDSFMSNMSHELRTPLNSIIGFSSLLIKKQMDNTHIDMSKQVHASATSLLKLIDDILDLAKIKNESFSIDPFDFNAYNSMVDFSQQFEALSHIKSLQFQTNISNTLKDMFFGDINRINQISLNLISNALKFTPKNGKITFSAQYKENSLILRIADNGIGMSQSVQDKAFKPFEQADGTIARQYGGTGLGLSITQNLVELMDGTIELESNENVGTTFIVTLPLLKSSHQDSNLSQISTQKLIKDDTLKGHILIAEDNKTNQMLITMLVNDFGLTCDIANDGYEATQIYNPDKHLLILMDENMPNMNGMEAMKIIQDKYTEECPPIIALTANAMKGDKQKFLDAGMNGYVAKPIDEDELYSTLVEFL